MIDFSRDRFSMDLDLKQSIHSHKIVSNFLSITISTMLVIYPLGVWLSFWSFSGIIMSTIVIVFVYILHSTVQSTLERQQVGLGVVDLLISIIENREKTDKQINELLILNKELLDKVNKLEDKIVAQEEVVKGYFEQLAVVLLKKMDKSEEQLNTVIAEKTEVIKTTLSWHSRTLDLDIKSNKLEMTTLEGMIETINERNEELDDMYEPLITYVSNLTDDMEYGKLLSEQIRAFMHRSAEQIEKNEKLVEEVEIMLAYQRNQRN